MAEGVIGLAASAITLAALFSSCIECFSYFKEAQNCPADAETLLVKLDCEKARLLVWANAVGLYRTEQTARSKQLDDTQLEPLLRRCFEQIINLLTDAQKLQDEYGSRPTTQYETGRYIAIISTNGMQAFKTSKLRFFARAGATREVLSWATRIKWAIRDAAKFRILVANLKDFVDNVIALVSVSPDVMNSAVEEDITTMTDMNALRLTENACDENYPSWAARASDVIRESELGTLDRRTLEEVLNDKEDDDMPRSQPEHDFAQDSNFQGPVHRYLLQATYVIFTEQCLNTQSDDHCEAMTIGKAIHDGQLSFACSYTDIWNTGRRILENTPKFCPTPEYRQEAEAYRVKILKDTGKPPEIRPQTRIFIHCGPCACAISMALEMTINSGASVYKDFAIRVDPRIPTSCRRTCSVVDVLSAVHDYADGVEVKSSNERLAATRYIDRPSLERAIYRMEQDPSINVDPTSIAQQILYETYLDKLNMACNAIVIIAEVDLCNGCLDRRPLVSEPRKPRAREMYRIGCIENTEDTGSHREFIGKYSGRKIPKDKSKV